jgi:hypothetical protein
MLPKRPETFQAEQQFARFKDPQPARFKSA